jgi:GMP synthase (glutamine-hydrolysing)
VSPGRPTVLVVASAADPDAGYVGERLLERGLALRTVLRDDHEVPAAVPGDVEAVLLLGSAWSVVEPDDLVALELECALVRSAVDARVPVLGLCYGAQVVARALGGEVRRAARPEVGLVTVETRDPELVPSGPWHAFHTDVVSPPPGAEVVASNECGVQAYVLPGVLAVQFHPEVVPATFEDWMHRLPDLVVAAGADPVALASEARGREAAARSAAHDLVDAFLARSSSSP